MNSLSWMIYAADVAGSVSIVGTAIAIGAGLGGVASVIANSLKTDFDNVYRKKSDELPVLKTGWQAGRGFFKVGIIAALVVIPFPSSTTIYAIAASEMGESVLNSDTGGKAVEALNAWLDRQIAGEAE